MVKVIQTYWPILHKQHTSTHIYETKYDRLNWRTTATTILQPLYRTNCVSQHPSQELGGFSWSTFTATHTLADSNQRIELGEKTLVFSSMVLPAPALYLVTKLNSNYGCPAQQMRTLYFRPVPVVSSFFPHLISAVTDCMSTTLPHMVWP